MSDLIVANDENQVAIKKNKVAVNKKSQANDQKQSLKVQNVETMESSDSSLKLSGKYPQVQKISEKMLLCRDEVSTYLV